MKLLILLMPFTFFQNTNIFNQLVGTWQMQTPKGVLYESWQPVSEGKIAGMSYMLNGKDSSVFERTIVTKEGSDIYFNAMATRQNNGQTVRFKLANTIGKYYIFENKQHDFPQRVIYEFVSSDSIHARIEGKQNGKDAAQDFYYSRKK
jgi:hypothetical protein